MWRALLALTLAFVGASCNTASFEAANTTQQWTYSFAVDYENDRFLLDGQPFRYVSGSFHYFRAPRQYWRDRLRKIRAAGLNAVSTYVEWSLHQPEHDQWNWSGDADLAEFLNIAQEEGLFVLLRPGPYICAERDLGGLPYWLLRLVPDIKLRTHDTRYMTFVEEYFNELFTRIRPFLRCNGGPVIMVQVENEYGSYYACDTDYMNKLRDIFQRHVGNCALLYTTDGNSDKAVRCGMAPGAYTTIDFGTGVNVTRSFEVMRRYQPRGPLVNSEYYPGWLTHWKEPFQTVKTKAVVDKLDEMLALGASVNIYMFYGGTNFAYTSGANGGIGQFSPQITSYDYDAPLTEAGDPTDKYFQIRNTVAKYLPMPNVPLPTVSIKGDYGVVLLETVLLLFDPLARDLFGSVTKISNSLMTFEEFGGNPLFVLYETDLPNGYDDPATLRADSKDRTLIYVDDQLNGVLSRIDHINSINLESPYAKKLQLLVENQGHLNFGDQIHDFKGVSNVKLGSVSLAPWNMTAFRINDPSPLNYLTNRDIQVGLLRRGPVFLRGRFVVDGEPLDTYLDTTGWGKGVAFINGNNLGRYWPLAGPQMTLYVPATFLRSGTNELVLLETEYVPNSRKMKFQNIPNLGKHIEKKFN